MRCSGLQVPCFTRLPRCYLPARLTVTLPRTLHTHPFACVLVAAFTHTHFGWFAFVCVTLQFALFGWFCGSFGLPPTHCLRLHAVGSGSARHYTLVAYVLRRALRFGWFTAVTHRCRLLCGLVLAFAGFCSSAAVGRFTWFCTPCRDACRAHAVVTAALPLRALPGVRYHHAGYHAGFPQFLRALPHTAALPRSPVPRLRYHFTFTTIPAFVVPFWFVTTHCAALRLRTFAAFTCVYHGSRLRFTGSFGSRLPLVHAVAWFLPRLRCYCRTRYMRSLFWFLWFLPRLLPFTPFLVLTHAFWFPRFTVLRFGCVALRTVLVYGSVPVGLRCVHYAHRALHTRLLRLHTTYVAVHTFQFYAPAYLRLHLAVHARSFTPVIRFPVTRFTAALLLRFCGCAAVTVPVHRTWVGYVHHHTVTHTGCGYSCLPYHRRGCTHVLRSRGSLVHTHCLPPRTHVTAHLPTHVYVRGCHTLRFGYTRLFYALYGLLRLRILRLPRYARYCIGFTHAAGCYARFCHYTAAACLTHTVPSPPLPVLPVHHVYHTRLRWLVGLPVTRGYTAAVTAFTVHALLCRSGYGLRSVTFYVGSYGSRLRACGLPLPLLRLRYTRTAVTPLRTHTSYAVHAQRWLRADAHAAFAFAVLARRHGLRYTAFCRCYCTLQFAAHGSHGCCYALRFTVCHPVLPLRLFYARFAVYALHSALLHGWTTRLLPHVVQFACLPGWICLRTRLPHRLPHTLHTLHTRSYHGYHQVQFPTHDALPLVGCGLHLLRTTLRFGCVTFYRLVHMVATLRTRTVRYTVTHTGWLVPRGYTPRCTHTRIYRTRTLPHTLPFCRFTCRLRLRVTHTTCYCRFSRYAVPARVCTHGYYAVPVYCGYCVLRTVAAHVCLRLPTRLPFTLPTAVLRLPYTTHTLPATWLPRYATLHTRTHRVWFTVYIAAHVLRFTAWLFLQLPLRLRTVVAGCGWVTFTPFGWFVAGCWLRLPLPFTPVGSHICSFRYLYLSHSSPHAFVQFYYRTTLHVPDYCRHTFAVAILVLVAVALRCTRLHHHRLLHLPVYADHRVRIALLVTARFLRLPHTTYVWFTCVTRLVRLRLVRLVAYTTPVLGYTAPRAAHILYLFAGAMPLSHTRTLPLRLRGSAVTHSSAVDCHTPVQF